MTTVINMRFLSSRDRQRVLAGTLPGHVYIGRHSLNCGEWGNRYATHSCTSHGVIVVKTRAEAVARHREDIGPGMRERIRQELRDKVLVCWCRPEDGFRGRLLCHGQTYAGIADGIEPAAVE